MGPPSAFFASSASRFCLAAFAASASEPRAFRALALAAAALRRMRAVGGVALESAIKEAAAASGAGEATLAVLGEAVCGPGGFEAAATVSTAPAADVDVAMAE